MSYLDKIAEKKQIEATRAESKQDVDSIIKELKEIQLSNLLKNSGTSPVILADSTDLGRVVTELGDKIIDVLEAFKKDTASTDKLAAISDNFRTLTQALKEQSSKTVNAISSIRIPAPQAPIVKIQERQIDFSPIEKAVKQLVIEPKFSLEDYKAQDINDSEGDVQYIGFLNPVGDWYIIENKVKENSLRYVFGRGSYTKAFSKAGSYQYSILSEAIDAL